MNSSVGYGKLLTGTRDKKVALIMLALLMAIMGVYWILRFLGNPGIIESVNFVKYRDPEIRANITEIGSGYYAIVSKKGKEIRLGILNESVLNELISAANSVIEGAESITLEEFNSLRINKSLSLKQRAKAYRGANLTLFSDFTVEMNLFPDLTLIQVNASKQARYFKSHSLDLKNFFQHLYNLSEYYTIRALNLSWIKLQKKGKLPYKYKIGSIFINQSSDKPIVITMVWKGCPCQFNPPETFQFSLEELLEG